MIFNRITLPLVIFLTGLLTACGDADKERHLVDLFTTANQDVIQLEFPATTQTVISANSEVDFSILGLKPNGIDKVTVSEDVQWSLSPNTVSSIDRRGHFTAGDQAESLTVTARLGVLSESIDVRVSTAQFDQVVQLDESVFTIDMCLSRDLTPIGRYVDEDGNEEIRPVDSTLINSISWAVLNAEDSSASQRAYIDVLANQASLHTLEAGDLIIRATAPSLFQGIDVTSADLEQIVGSGLNSVKLCLAGELDLANCIVTSASVEKDRIVSLIAVGNYQTGVGSSVNENVTRNVKWGTSDSTNASGLFSLDRQQFDVTGDVEDSSTTLSAACGAVDQSLAGIDITQGVIYDTPVSCGLNADCVVTSALLDIDPLSVIFLDVSANGINLIDDTTEFLGSRPAEITLVVNANFSNSTQADITSDSELVYTIIAIDGQLDVIEQVAGVAGSFTVLGPGTAKIQLNFRNETFIVVLQIP